MAVCVVAFLSGLGVQNASVCTHLRSALKCAFRPPVLSHVRPSIYMPPTCRTHLQALDMIQIQPVRERREEGPGVAGLLFNTAEFCGFPSTRYRLTQDV